MSTHGNIVEFPVLDSSAYSTVSGTKGSHRISEPLILSKLKRRHGCRWSTEIPRRAALVHLRILSASFFHFVSTFKSSYTGSHHTIVRSLVVRQAEFTSNKAPPKLAGVDILRPVICPFHIISTHTGKVPPVPCPQLTAHLLPLENIYRPPSPSQAEEP